MRQQWERALERLEVLTKRERALVLGCAVAVMVLLWNWLLLTPFEARQAQLRSQTEAVQRELQALHAQAELVSARAHSDPNRELRQRLRLLEARVADVDRAIAERGAEFVQPPQMARLLRDLLEAQSGLTLLRLESAPAERLRTDSGGMPVYRHGMVLEFRADYLATLRFLETLESLPWSVFWDELEYRLETHPHARVRLRLSTLSGYEDWIGV